jgi:ribosomal protein S18 acetylase RimI-like enzyme
MKPPTIRRGVVADAAALASFAARTFYETFAAHNRPENMHAHLTSAYGEEQQARELADPDVATLLVHDSESLIAYAQVRRSPPPPCVVRERPIELRRFYIDRAFHGGPVAPVLMRAVRGVAREFGGRHLWLGVWEHNPRAQAFYRKQGFVDVGSTVFHVGSDRQADRVFVAPIAPETT